MEHTAVGMTFVCRRSRFLAPVQRNKFWKLECAGTNYSAGKRNKSDKVHDGV
jgi:hypothetical protein